MRHLDVGSVVKYGIENGKVLTKDWSPEKYNVSLELENGDRLRSPCR